MLQSEADQLRISGLFSMVCILAQLHLQLSVLSSVRNVRMLIGTAGFGDLTASTSGGFAVASMIILFGVLPTFIFTGAMENWIYVGVRMVETKIRKLGISYLCATRFTSQRRRQKGERKPASPCLRASGPFPCLCAWRRRCGDWARWSQMVLIASVPVFQVSFNISRSGRTKTPCTSALLLCLRVR